MMKRLYLLIASLLFLGGCSYAQSSTDTATRIVKGYIEAEATDPLHRISNWKNFMHPDFVAVGGEGSLSISIIDPDYSILSTVFAKGDINIISPGEEEYLKVTVRLKELFLVKNDQVQKTNRAREVLFILSKRGSNTGNYQILDIENFEPGIRLGYLQSVKKEFLATEQIEKRILYKEILKKIEGLGY